MAKSALSMLLTTPVPVLQFCSDLSKGFHTRHIAGPDILVSLLPIYEPIKDRSVLISVGRLYVAVWTRVSLFLKCLRGIHIK